MMFMGIDPGKKGGVAVIEDGRILYCMPLTKSSFFEAVDLSTEYGDMIACLEKVHAMPKQGSVSMFTFGEGYGWLKGVMDSEQVRYQEIAPQTWKKEFSLNSDKNRSIEVAKQLFPEADLFVEGHRKESDGMAEALLMAEYARRKLWNTY